MALFDEMITVMICNKELNPIVTELFNKVDISKFQINESFNKLHIIIHQILAQRTSKPYSFLETDTRLASDNPLGFRKNLLKANHGN